MGKTWPLLGRVGFMLNECTSTNTTTNNGDDDDDDDESERRQRDADV